MIYRSNTYHVLFLFAITFTATLHSNENPHKAFSIATTRYWDDCLPGNIDVSLTKNILNSAPQGAKNIVTMLQDTNFPRTNCHYAIFLGNTGTAKTATANAIAYTMYLKKWRIIQVQGAFLVGTPESEIEYMLDSINKEQIPTILIIDNFDDLFKNNSDPASIKMSQWFQEFVTDQDKNPYFFMMGTMDSNARLPQDINHEIASKKIAFRAPTNIDIKRQAFLNHLIQGDPNFIKLEDNVDELYLNQMLQQCISCDFRTLEGLALKIRLLYRNDNHTSKNMIIGRKHIDRALREVLREKEELGLNNTI